MVAGQIPQLRLVGRHAGGDRERRLGAGGGGEQLAPHAHQRPGRKALAGLLDQAAQDHGLAARADRRLAGGGGALDARDLAHDAQAVGQQLDHRPVETIDLAAQFLELQVGRTGHRGGDLLRAVGVRRVAGRNALHRSLSTATPLAPQGRAGCTPPSTAAVTAASGGVCTQRACSLTE